MTLSQVDFLRKPGPPLVGWILLGAGVALLASALWFGDRWSSERTAVARAQEDLVAAQRVRQAPAKAPEPTLAQRRWQQARTETRRPWLPTLKAIESATVNPVFLLSLSVDPVTGLIKLDAEAPSFDHALAYVQLLDEGETLKPAVMVSHEQTIDPTGRSAVKFSATTRWVTP